MSVAAELHESGHDGSSYLQCWVQTDDDFRMMTIMRMGGWIGMMMMIVVMSNNSSDDE